MRQFVFGLLAAAFVWWGWSTFSASNASAGGTPSNGGGPGTAKLADVLPGGGQPAPSPAAPPAEKPPQPQAAPAPASAPVAAAPAAVADVVAAIGQNDGAAIARGWSLLASGAATGDAANQLRGALQGGGDGFAAQFARLGSFNSFLHSAAGREQAGKVLALAMAMPDADAVAAGSRFLDLCLRGPIEKSDVDARAFVEDAYRQHRIRVDRWLCDPANVQSARSYTVAAGDSLARIAGRFRKEKVLVEEGTLAILNRIHNPNALQVGQKIKVPVDPIHSVVEKRSYSLCVYVGESLLRMYWVGHGENDKTPVAEFTIAEKQPKPEWTAPDGRVLPYGNPENILGEYFIKLQHASYTGFGIHGTPMPETIGTMSSMGCIRMLAQDIEELFRLLPRGTRVEIRASAPQS